MDVEVVGVTVEFPGVTALSDIDLQLSANRIHGLLGRNGAGKSTLLSVLSGFRKPTHGQVLADGEPVFENPKRTGHICLVREVVDTLDTSDKVEDSLALTRQMRPSWDDNFADHLIGRFGLDTTKKIGSLSRGKRAALGIVIGMASRAPLTMFDESYLGLDAAARYLFYEELLDDYSKHLRTFVISTHLIEEISSLFEEVSILHQGRLLLQDSAENLRAQGAEIIGPGDQVDEFLDHHQIVASREMGRLKAVTITAELGEESRRAAIEAGLEVNPVPLQDLFVHITGDSDE